MFHENYNKAKEIVATLSLEEKVGQLFLCRCPDVDAIKDIKEYNLGGYILFSRDLDNKTKDEVKSTLASYKTVSKLPFIIAVDEEGGSVVRVSSNHNLSNERFLSPSALFNIGGFNAIKDDTKKKCSLLKDLGINLNLAPVADVSTNPRDYIYPRTLGISADETSNYVSLVVNTMKECNMSSCLKHFPGYGNNLNTHTGISIDSRPIEIFEKSDLLPFKAGIEAGCETILVSHNIVQCFDNINPASLSPSVHDYLKNQLGYTGIVMTDDLDMDAIKEYYQSENPSVSAIIAGNDLIIITDYISGINSIIEAINTGKISEDRIDESVIKILAWKLSFN